VVTASGLHADETPDETLNPTPNSQAIENFSKRYCIKLQNNKSNELDISLWAFSKSPVIYHGEQESQIRQMSPTILDIKDCSTRVRIKNINGT
jgi:hypothetical protein